jgi:hypothetical protein
MYYKVDRDFVIRKGAGHFTFRQDQVWQSRNGRPYSWNRKRGKWDSEPIGAKIGIPLGGNQIKELRSNSSAISKEEVEQLTTKTEQRMAVKVREVPRIIEQLGLKPRDEIILIIPPRRR